MTSPPPTIRMVLSTSPVRGSAPPGAGVDVGGLAPRVLAAGGVPVVVGLPGSGPIETPTLTATSVRGDDVATTATEAAAAEGTAPPIPVRR